MKEFPLCQVELAIVLYLIGFCCTGLVGLSLEGIFNHIEWLGIIEHGFYCETLDFEH